MKIKEAKIIAVTSRQEQYPVPDMPEIAFAGRSNVGKSSLLNLLTKRKKLAKVSSSPGKTRTINFYEINGTFRIVDLPGYGYAKVSKKLSDSWGSMIETYLEKRKNLAKVIQLVDIRHEPTKQDIQMYEYLKYFNLDGFVVATKSDKISRNQLENRKRRIRQIFKMREENRVVAVSSLKRIGYEELLDMMEEIIRGTQK